jgi:hypothetical protein
VEQITLTPEQAAVLATAPAPVRICRPDGTVAGYLSRIFAPDTCPFTPEEIEAAIREAETCQQWFTTKEVLSRLRAQEQS